MKKDQIIPAIALVMSLMTGVYSYIENDAVSTEKLSSLEEKVEKIQLVTDKLPSHFTSYNRTVGYSKAQSKEIKDLLIEQTDLRLNEKLQSSRLDGMDAYIIFNENWKKETQQRVRATENTNIVNTQVLKELTTAVTNLSANTKKQTQFFEQVARNDERLKQLERNGIK